MKNTTINSQYEDNFLMSEAFCLIKNCLLSNKEVPVELQDFIKESF